MAKPVFLPLERPIARFSSDAASLSSYFSTGAWPETYNEGLVSESDIFVSIPHDVQKPYGLVAMHLVTKQLHDWFWMTLWWAEAASADFGSDRPSLSQQKLANYKMCAVSSFSEVGWGDTPGSLKLEYDAIRKQSPTASWCSNFFIETMDHGQDSNCVGCHQHASSQGIPKFADRITKEKTAPISQGHFAAGFHGDTVDFLSAAKSL